MDIHSPLVVSTHELGRQPGAMRTLERTVPAPADMGTTIIAVPQGASLALKLRLEAVMDGVLVSGTVTAALAGECVRCLAPVEQRIAVDVAELYLYPGGREAARADGDEEAEELYEIEGDHLDLEPALRDAVVLALPFQPLCRPDCPGLCPDCGIRLEDAEPGHHHEVLDPRWAALEKLLGGDEGQGR